MAITKMSALFLIALLVVIFLRNSDAAPVRDYDGVPSGVLHPISGVVPISVPRRRPDAANKILEAIRKKVDKSEVNDLDSNVRDDILQDALAPPECIDKYGIRDGTLKHLIRGVRDIGGALVKDFQALGQGILKDLPLVPNVVNGAGEAITYVFCGIEDALSDIVSDGFDEGEDILTKILVDVIDLDGSAPLANVPAGIVNLTSLIGTVGKKAAEDLALAIENGVEDLVTEVVNGVEDVVNDVEGVVSGVETGVLNVVNAVDGAVEMIGGGIGTGVGNIVSGIKGGLEDVVNAL